MDALFSRKGEGPQTLAEKRELLQKKAEKDKIQKQETESEKITLREVAERYLKVHKGEVVASTWKATESYYRNWLDKELGDRKLIDIKVDDIQPIVVKVLEDHPSRTAIYVKSVIRQIFNFAKNLDLYFFDNLATKVKIKQKNNSRTRF